jgi:hypothetical protein
MQRCLSKLASQENEHRRRLVGVLVLLSAILWSPIGCGRQAKLTSPSLPPSAAQAVETPEKCFHSFAARRNDDDPEGMLPYITDVHQDFFAGVAAIALQREVDAETERATACLSVLQKYDLDVPKAVRRFQESQVGDARIGLVQLGHHIMDKLQFFRDAKAARPGPKVAKESQMPVLQKLEVDGDIATGIVVSGDEEGPIVFRKMDDGWRVALDVNEVVWLKDQQD